jgi:hypothetical protein
MSLIKSYLSVLNEDKEFTSKGIVKGTEKSVGDLEGAKANAKPKTSATQNVKNLETPVKGPHSEVESEELPTPVKTESAKNPFDVLFNRIVAQEGFGDEESGETLDFEGEVSHDHESEDSLGDESDLDFNDDEESAEGEEEDEVTFTLDRATAEKLVEVLQGVLGGNEEESEEGEDLEGDEDQSLEDKSGDEDLDGSGDSIPFTAESVEAEEEGTALVDKDKLEKGLTSKGNQTVKGAVPVSKKKGEVVKGKKATKKFEPFNKSTDELTSKGKQNVGGVTVGKGLFDQ